MFGALAHDVPQRTVDGATSRCLRPRLNASRSSVQRRLPDVFDLVDVATDDHRLQELLDVSGDNGDPFRVVAITDSVQAQVRS